MIKLSEFKDEDILLVDNIIMTKTELLNELNVLKEDDDKLEVYTTKISYEVKFNAKEILDSVIDEKSKFMYKEWSDSISRDITDDDLQKIQVVLDEILERNKDRNVSYCVDEDVQIDINGEEEMDDVL